MVVSARRVVSKPQCDGTNNCLFLTSQLFLITLNKTCFGKSRCVLNSIAINYTTEIKSWGFQDRELRKRETWAQCCSIQTEVDSALPLLHFIRHVSQLRANTAQVKNFYDLPYLYVYIKKVV